MIKYTVASLIALAFVVNPVSGQSFKIQFNDLLSSEDTVGQQKLLESWEKTDQNDPELFVAYFNYYVNKGKSDIMTLGQDPEGDIVYQITDQDTTKKEPVGYLYNDRCYNMELISRGLDWVNKGIEKHPNRLDMRFGKIYMYGQLEDYESFTKEIIAAIAYSAVNKNKWTWADNEPLENSEDFFLGSIQQYQNQLYSTENDSLLDNMRRIAEAVLKVNPNHIESLSNLSIVCMLNKQFKRALDHLLKAEKINPKDCIVLNNIAFAYKGLGDRTNAIKYYKLMITYGDEHEQAYAKEEIQALQQNNEN